MKSASSLKFFLIFFAVFAVIVVFGYLVTEDKKERTRQFNLRNIQVESTPSELRTGGSRPEEELEPAQTPEQESEAAESETTEETEEEKKEDPVALAEQKDRASFKGQVLTIDETPLSELEFSITFQDSIEGGKKPPSYKTKTDTNGYFEFPEILAGKYTADIKLTGFNDFHQKNINAPEGNASDSVILTIEPNLILKGKISDEKKEAIYGARVLISKPELTLDVETNEAIRQEITYRETYTNQKGEFEIKQIAPGDYILRVSAAGYLGVREEILFESKSINNFQRQLEPASEIGGIVRSVEGLAIGGAKLKAMLVEDEKKFWEVESLETGRFFFPSLPKDQLFNIEAKAEGYAPAKVTEIPDGRENVVIELVAGASIEGKVTDFNTNIPVADIGLSLRNTSDPTLKLTQVRSDALGNYRIANLAAGEYDVLIESEKYTSEPKLGIALKTGEKKNKVDFSIYEGKLIQGFVSDAATGERIPEAKVELTSQVGPAYLTNKKSNTTTDEFGIFNFTNLPFGFYYVSSSADGYLRVPGDESSAEVHIVPGAETEPVELFLYRGGVIAGKVISSENEPVANADIQLYNDRSAAGKLNNKQLRKFDMQTDSGGSFLIDGIPLDDQLTLVVSANAKGHGKGSSEPVLLTQDVPDGHVTVKLTRPQTISVTVVDEVGLRIHDARVDYNSYSFPGDREPSHWADNTKELGMVVLTDLPEGGGYIRASKKGYFSEGKRINLPSEEDSEVTFALEKCTTISGRVFDDAGIPFTSGYVQAYAERGARGGGRGNIGEGGKFEIEGIGKGNFRLEARAERQTPGDKHVVFDQKRFVVSGAQDVEFRIPLRGNLQGLVLDGETSDPIAKATVHISGDYYTSTYQRKTFRAKASTKSEPGLIQFESLPPGSNFTLTITSPGYLSKTIEDIRIESPGSHSFGKVVLDKGSVLTGTVIDYYTNQRIGGAKVVLKPSGKDEHTNGSGNFRFVGLEAEIYNLEVSHRDYQTKKFSLVPVSENDIADAGELALDKGASLEVKVDDGVGRPVKSAYIVVRSEIDDWQKTGRTNAGGRDTLYGLKPGAVDVSVTATFPNGKITESAVVSLSMGETRELEVSLYGDNILRGQIFPAMGVFITSSRVEIYPKNLSGRPVVNGSMRPTVNGTNFVQTEIPRGDYIVCIASDTNRGMIYWFREIAVDKPVVEQSFAMPGGSIRGKVFAEDETFQLYPLDKGNIKLNALTSPMSEVSGFNKWTKFNQVSDGVGFYQFQNLHDGVYEIRISHDDFQIPYVDILTINDGRSLQEDAIFEKESLD